MKAKNLTLVFILFIVNLNAQSFNTITKPQDEHTISVTGSAEMLVKPDEVEIEFTLKEYMLDRLKKYQLASAEKEFMKILDSFGFKEKDILLSTNLYSSYTEWQRNKSVELKSKTFSIKIDSSTNLNNLIKAVDKRWLDEMNITKVKNKKETEYRQQLKLQAIKAAKEKAKKLLEAIDEEIGYAITINEINDESSAPNYSSYRSNGSYSIANTNVSSQYANNRNDNSTEKEGVSNVNMIKLRYEISAVFQIKPKTK